VLVGLKFAPERTSKVNEDREAFERGENSAPFFTTERNAFSRPNPRQCSKKRAAPHTERRPNFHAAPVARGGNIPILRRNNNAEIDE
jgi:hypothetical protein